MLDIFSINVRYAIGEWCVYVCMFATVFFFHLFFRHRILLVKRGFLIQKQNKKKIIDILRLHTIKKNQNKIWNSIKLNLFEEKIELKWFDRNRLGLHMAHDFNLQVKQ